MASSYAQLPMFEIPDFQIIYQPLLLLSSSNQLVCSSDYFHLIRASIPISSNPCIHFLTVSINASLVYLSSLLTSLHHGFYYLSFHEFRPLPHFLILHEATVTSPKLRSGHFIPPQTCNGSQHPKSRIQIPGFGI